MSEKELLNVKDLVVDVEEKEILHGVNLTIRLGETHVLMGPNGTGKSTLGYTLLGNPRYTVKQGEIRFDGKNITAEPVNERAKAGIFIFPESAGSAGCDTKLLYQKCGRAKDRQKNPSVGV